MANITPGMLAGLRYSKSMSDNDLQNEHNRKNSAMFNSTIGNIQPLEIARQQDSTFQTGYPFSNSNPIDNPPKQYAATKLDEGSSAIGTEQAQDAFGSLMSTRGEGDPRSNERYQQLLARRDDIVAEIHRLMSEISWQETLKARNLTQDPLWEEAKYNWIYKGDDSGMKNIRDIEVKRKSDEEQRYWQAQENRKQRESTENLAKLNRDKELADAAEAKRNDYEDKLNVLNFILDDNKYKFNTPEVRSSIFRAWNDLDKAAKRAGISLDNDVMALEAQYPMYGKIKGFLGLSDKASGAPAGFANEDMTQLETRFNNAKTAKDMEAILKSAEGKIDPTKKTEWQEKIKNVKASESKRAKSRKDWDTKAKSAYDRVMGWSNTSRQKMFDENTGKVQDYVEQINGKFKIKKNPYGG